VTETVLGIRRANPGRPVYLLIPKHLRLPPDSVLSPSGMVFRLDEIEVAVPASRWDFTFHDTAGLTDPLPEDQRKKINEAYREMRAGFLRAYATGADELFRRGEHGAAVPLYVKAFELAPEREEFALRRGVGFVRSGRYDLAKTVFEAWVDVNPQSHQGYFNLGNVLDELGDSAGARRAYERSLTLKPGFEFARKALTDLGR
jgi:tetratricopeptide (TPR) repeat protein